MQVQASQIRVGLREVQLGGLPESTRPSRIQTLRDRAVQTIAGVQREFDGRPLGQALQAMEFRSAKQSGHDETAIDIDGLARDVVSVLAG